MPTKKEGDDTKVFLNKLKENNMDEVEQLNKKVFVDKTI
jgi:hypothetical protein